MSNADDFAVRYVNLDDLLPGIGPINDVDLGDAHATVFADAPHPQLAVANENGEAKVVQRRNRMSPPISQPVVTPTGPNSVSTSRKFETIEQIIDQIGFGWFQIKLLLIVGFAMTADSMEMLTLSVLAPALRCEWNLTPFDESMITVVVFIGMLIGSAAWGKFCDRYGRKRCLVMFALLTGYYGFLCAFSPRFAWVLVLRGIVGFAIGGAPQTVTLLTEFLPSKHRAKCLIGIQVFWALGVFFETALALLVMPTLGWRYLLAFSTLPLFAFCLVCAWLPESPRYLVVSGQLDRVKHVLEKVSRNNFPNLARQHDLHVARQKSLGPNASSANYYVSESMHVTDVAGASNDSSVTSVDTSSTYGAIDGGFKLFDIDVSNLRIPSLADRGQLKQLFSTSYWRITMTLWPMWFSSAFSYYGIVLLTTVLLSSSPQSSMTCRLDCHPMTTSDYVDLILTSIAEFASLFGVFFIDCLGRRRSMALQYGGFALFTFLLIFIPNIGNRSAMSPSASSWQTVLLFFSRTFISSAYNTIYVYTPEVYPTSVRAIGLGACSSMARVGAILTPLVAQMLVSVSPTATLCLYTVAGLFATIASIVLPIETLGRRTHDTVADAEAENSAAAAAAAAATAAGTQQSQSQLNKPKAGSDC